MTRLTVFFETPARRATSLIVELAPRARRRCGCPSAWPISSLPQRLALARPCPQRRAVALVMTPVSICRKPVHLPTAPEAPALLRLSPDDDVAVRRCAGDVERGVAGIAATSMALRDLAAGAAVRKYGWPIGRLTEAVAAGGHVHSHNLETLLTGVEGYRLCARARRAAARATSATRFQGYRRADGRVGTRNEIWILPTVGCVARTAERIAAIAHARHAQGGRRRLRLRPSPRLLAARRGSGRRRARCSPRWPAIPMPAACC